MANSNPAILLLVGAVIGVIGGALGIGGGVLVIPVLMTAFGFTQARANGTSVAMLLPPIGIFAVMAYWRAGNVDFRFALLLSAGFAVGAYGGARLVNSGAISPTALRVAFAVLLLYIASRLLFRGGGRARAALETTLLMGGYLASYASLRLLGRRWSRQRPDPAGLYTARVREAVDHDYEI